MINRRQNAVHHWWPEGLSQFWIRDDGCISCLSSKGDVTNSPPKNFGGIKNAHNIYVGSEESVWDISFEDDFSTADNHFPNLAQWLIKISKNDLHTEGDFASRLRALCLDNDMRKILEECSASLIARSPRFRHQVRSTAEAHRRSFGFVDPSANKTLVNANLRRAHKTLVDTINRGGKFLILSSSNEEFIFGDGFYNNFEHPTFEQIAPRFLIPITPKVAIFYTRSTRHRIYPKLLSMRLSDNEVKFLNGVLQIYCRRFIFYREMPPSVTDEFNSDQYLEYVFHKHSWLDSLDFAISYTAFGPDNDFI